MDPKKIIVFAMTVACAACAQERPASIFSIQPSHLNGPAEHEADVEVNLGARQVGKKSQSDKMLAAIALERVTGRKPDPARLLESY